VAKALKGSDFFLKVEVRASYHGGTSWVSLSKCVDHFEGEQYE